MYVLVDGGLTIAPSDRGEIWGPVVAKSSRVFREPGILYPGLACLLVWDGNPEVFELSTGNSDTEWSSPALFSATGCQSGYYRCALWADFLEIQTSPVLPSPVRARAQGEFTVATLEVDYLYEGADLATRVIKLSAYAREVLGSPDILAVQGVESAVALEAVADQIRNDDASVDYGHSLLEGNDSAGMNIGFLYRQDIILFHAAAQIGADLIFPSMGRLSFSGPL